MSVPPSAHHDWRSSPLLGREPLLRMLATRLQTEGLLVIGVDPALQYPTGIGRTRLAEELIHQWIGSQPQVIRLNGISRHAWISSLLRATQQLGLRPSPFRRAADLKGTLRAWLNSHDNWVVLADNVIEPDSVSEITDGITQGQLIVLPGRNAEALPAHWPAAVPLGALSPNDGLEFLKNALQREWFDTQEVIAATQVVNRLERNPLRLDLASRTMRLEQLSLEEYLQVIESARQHSPSVACVKLAVEAARSLCPPAPALLAAVMAWGTSPIPATTLRTLSEHSQSADTRGDVQAWNILVDAGLLRSDDGGIMFEVTARDDLNDLLAAEMRTTGLDLLSTIIPPRTIKNRLRDNVAGNIETISDPFASQRVSMGQLLASLSRLRCEQIDTLRQAADAALDLLLPEIAQKLLLHALEQTLKFNSEGDSLRPLLVELGTAYQLGEQFQLARKRWRQAVEFSPADEPQTLELLLAIAEIDVNENRLDRAAERLQRVAFALPANRSESAVSLLHAQLLYLQAGIALAKSELEPARQLFREALAIRQPILPADHPLMMRNRLMLARTEFLVRDYASSELLLREEVAIRESSWQVSESDLSVACNFLGEQYYLTGRLSDAEPVYERVLELRRATLPRGHRLIGEMANRLAVIKSARGGYKESDALFREALSNIEGIFGTDHPEVARVLNDLAESLFSQNKIDPARRLLERALQIQDKSLRSNDVRVGRTRCNLAAVYVARGRFAEAIRLYERDVAERLKHKAPDQASLATSLNNLAEALRSVGRYADAEEKLLQALSIREKLIGANHPQVAQILNNLGYLYLQLHRYDAAREALERSLRIREACLAPQHPHLATTLGTLAEVYFTQRQYEVARTYYSRAIEIFVSAYGERHPHSATLQICSARNELRLGHVGRAELMLLRGKVTIGEVLGADHRMSAKVLLGIAELAHYEKRYDTAFPLLERCLTIQMATMSSYRLEIVETLRLIAENLVARGLYAEALPRMVEAVDIQQKVLPSQHPEIMPHLLLIGRIQHHLNQPAPAEEALRTVIDHADPASQSELIHEARHLLPDILIQQQEYTQAAEMLQQQVDSLEAAGSAPLLLSTLSQLAAVHYLRSAPEEAAPLMERCVSLSEQIHGSNSPETAKHLDNLAGVHFLLGQYQVAEPAIRRAIAILEQECPVRPAALSKARENYIQLMRHTDRQSEADQLAARLSPPIPVVESVGLPSSHVLDDL